MAWNGLRRLLESKHAVWIRYAVTWLLVLAIPLAAFNLYFGAYIAEEARSAMESSLQARADKFRADFEERVRQMVNIAFQVEKVRDFSSTSLLQYSYASRSAIRSTLNAYVGTNSFYRDIAYSHRALPQVVFTASGTCSPASYRQFYSPKDGQWLPIHQRNMGESYGKGWILPGENKPGLISLPSCLIYCQPLQNSRDMVLLFEITESAIRALLPAQDAYGEVYILLGQDKLLYPFDASALPPLGDLEKPELMADGRYRMTVYSPEYDLTYIYAADMDNVANATRRAMNTLFALTLMVSLGCVVIVVLISGRHARPIDQLVTLTAGMVPGEVRGVERIKTAVNQLQSRSEELDALRRDNLRNHALIRLIRGKYHSEEEARYNLDRLEIHLTQPYQVIMLLRQEGENDTQDAPARLAARLSPHAYGFSYADRGAYVILTGMETEDRTPLVQELNRLLALPEFAGCGLRIALGGSFSQLGEAQGSYMQALSCRRKDSAAVALFEESGESQMFTPAEELQALGQALVNQDRNRADFLFDVLLRLIGQNNRNYLYSVSLLSRMIEIYGQFLAPGQAAFNEEIHDPDDMLSTVRALHMNALQRMTQDELNNTMTEMMGIASYISNCEAWDTLTVSKVADQFGISVSSLSHRFKEQMGCNISDYICTCKMNYACTLLRNTDTTVTDIASQLGYSQYTSFVRTFKRMKGVTPSAYRELAPEALGRP